MKKYFLFSLLLFSYCKESKCQSNKNLDWVIVVNEKIDLFYTAPQFIVTFNNDSSTRYKSSYHPGNLTIGQKEYDMLISDSTKSIRLEIVYYSHDKNQSVYTYKLDFKKGFLKETYLVLKIYNMDRKKYRKKFDPIDKESDFTFEIDSPSQSLRRAKSLK